MDQIEAYIYIIKIQSYLQKKINKVKILHQWLLTLFFFFFTLRQIPWLLASSQRASSTGCTEAQGPALVDRIAQGPRTPWSRGNQHGPLHAPWVWRDLETWLAFSFFASWLEAGVPEEVHFWPRLPSLQALPLPSPGSSCPSNTLQTLLHTWPRSRVLLENLCTLSFYLTQPAGASSTWEADPTCRRAALAQGTCSVRHRGRSVLPCGLFSHTLLWPVCLDLCGPFILCYMFKSHKDSERTVLFLLLFPAFFIRNWRTTLFKLKVCNMVIYCTHTLHNAYPNEVS